MFIILVALGIACLVAIAAGLAVGYRRIARRESMSRFAALTELDASPPPPTEPLFNIDFPEPADHVPRWSLSCPHCSYEQPFDDPSLLGQSVLCPLCEELFLVLEPDLVTTDGPVDNKED